MRTVTDAESLAPAHGGVLVPTMGGLHEGHAALIRAARDAADGAPVVVSVFVNPTQFEQRADFDRYPRTLAADEALAKAAGATHLFAPPPGVVYPVGESVPVPPLPPVAYEPGLEDTQRPGHFEGVCQVVARLFALARPAAAVFGEKDWQQLQTIRAMVARDRLPVRIIAVPTVREADGLAMSSRNRFLTPEQRRVAAAVPRALLAAQNCASVALAQTSMRSVLEGAGMLVDYAAVRDAATLRPITDTDRADARALLAVRMGQGDAAVRLIDNAPWPA